MFSVPVTFRAQFGNADERMRKFLLHEFADAGAKHLVLSSELIKAVMADHKFAPQLEKELAAIRKQGYAAMDVDELIRALGVPVRDAGGEPVMSLATAYPVFICRKSETEILTRMEELAAELEEELKIGDIRIADLKNGPSGRSGPTRGNS